MERLRKAMARYALNRGARSVAWCGLLALVAAPQALRAQALEPSTDVTVPAPAPVPAVAPAPAPTPLPRSVQLVQAPCALYDAAEAGALLSTELAALGIDDLVLSEVEPDAAALARDLAVLRVSCAELPDTVTVQLADLASGQALQRDVSVAGVEPKARSRLIAMTAAGLIESSWIELAVDPSSGRIALPEAVRDALRRRVGDALFSTQAPPAASPAPDTRNDEPASRPPARSSLQLTGAAQSFPARSTGLVGLTFGYAGRLGAHGRLWVDLDGQLGAYELRDDLQRIGSMHLYWLTGGLGVAWVSSTTPSIAIGPLIRAGIATASAEVSEGFAASDSANGLVTVLGLRATLEAPLSRAFSAVIAIDGGYMPNGIVFLVAQQRSVGMAEVALALRVGLSVQL